MATAAFLRSVETITDQWPEPSRCEGWTVANLVNHVIGGHGYTVALIEGRERPMDAAREAIDASANNRLAGCVHWTDRMHSAFAMPGVLRDSHDHLAGSVTGEVVAIMRLTDVTLHSWDLAVSLQRDPDLPVDLVRFVLDSFDHNAEAIAASGSLPAARDSASPTSGSSSELLDQLLRPTGRM